MSKLHENQSFNSCFSLYFTYTVFLRAEEEGKRLRVKTWVCGKNTTAGLKASVSYQKNLFILLNVWLTRPSFKNWCPWGFHSINIILTRWYEGGFFSLTGSLTYQYSVDTFIYSL